LEEYYQFESFHSPPLTDADIDAKPSVLLLGQYSVGKTTFIKYILDRDFPGCHIGPEPTTDGFSAIIGNKEDRIIPGSAAAISTDLPFTSLNKFGQAFLNKFQISQVNSPILDNITLIDTPGVLSGEKQSIGRSYDYPEVAKWFAERADLILLLFDAHKLDISDEFKSVIHVLKGHEDKMRVILNKADMVNGQQLMRVYGALMWSLGKVLNTPEVCRVYIGSFWDEELKCRDCESLLKAEEEDLLNDLRVLPRNAAIRKVNEMVKRAKLAKVHGLIISQLKKEMPSMFKKDSKQKELIDNLPELFKKLQQLHGLAPSDFPDIKDFQEKLRSHSFDKFNKYSNSRMTAIDEVLSVDMPKIMNDFPQGNAKVPEIMKNPFETGEEKNKNDHIFEWDSFEKSSFINTFNSLNIVNQLLSGNDAKPILEKSGLEQKVLGKIWVLADITKDGYLDRDEFCIAMRLCELANSGTALPETLPSTMYPPKRKI
jgi:GTP-binding protein EngB required for normal cell division